MDAEKLKSLCTADRLRPGETGLIAAVEAPAALKAELAAHGVAPGEELRFIKAAPLDDPVQLRVKGGNVCLRKKDAALILVGPGRERGGTEL